MPAAAYDFRAPLPMPAEAARLVAAVEDAAPRGGLMLSVACGRPVEMSCGTVERVSTEQLSRPGDTWVPLSCGLPAPALLVVPAALSTALADLFLGGAGAGDDRPATPLEQRLIVRHLLPALEPVRVALAEQGVTALAPGAPSTEPLPPSAGDTVAVRLTVTLASGVTGTATLAFATRALLPTAALEALIAAPSAPATAALADVAVVVALRLPGTVVTAADVEGLAVGDVLRLDHPLGTPVIGVVSSADGDQPFLLAGLGRRGRKRAVVVSELLGA